MAAIANAIAFIKVQQEFGSFCKDIWSFTNEQVEYGDFNLQLTTIDLNPDIAPERMPAKWDELRRKVINIQPQLPAGASSITVNDDFGDVFGIYYGLTADEGFSYSELRNWAQKIRTKLTPIEGVQKVMLYGEQTEVIDVSISPSKLASLGIDPSAIRATHHPKEL